MKKLSFFIVAILCVAAIRSQVAINADNSAPNASALLDVKSSTMGFLPPRMNTLQRESIPSPAEGLIIYNTDSLCLEFWDGTGWFDVCSGNSYVPPVVVASGGNLWMDRNLGASQVATSSTDALAYGDLYQWGRATDGHEKRTSGTTSTNAFTAVPNDGNTWDGLFITELIDPLYDWLTPQDNGLWQGVSGTNNPCPVGFRLPTETELNLERLSWSSNNIAGAFGSPLKFTLAGRRYLTGVVMNVGQYALYWTSTANGTLSEHMFIASVNAYLGTNYRAVGLSVRCLKD
jgi:hypothetical protein